MRRHECLKRALLFGAICFFPLAFLPIAHAVHIFRLYLVLCLIRTPAAVPVLLLAWLGASLLAYPHPLSLLCFFQLSFPAVIYSGSTTGHSNRLEYELRSGFRTCRAFHLHHIVRFTARIPYRNVSTSRKRFYRP